MIYSFSNSSKNFTVSDQKRSALHMRLPIRSTNHLSVVFLWPKAHIFTLVSNFIDVIHIAAFFPNFYDSNSFFAKRKKFSSEAALATEMLPPEMSVPENVSSKFA